MSSYTDKVILGMDRIINDKSFKNRLKKASEVELDTPEIAFENLSSEEVKPESCYDEFTSLCDETGSCDEFKSRIPVLAFNSPDDEFWKSPEAYDICDKLRNKVGLPDKLTEQTALAFQHITSLLSKSSVVLERIGLIKSAEQSLNLIESIIEEIAVKKVAQLSTGKDTDVEISSTGAPNPIPLPSESGQKNQLPTELPKRKYNLDRPDLSQVDDFDIDKEYSHEEATKLQKDLVREFIDNNIEDFIGAGDEVDATRLAEACAEEFNLYEGLNEEIPEWVFDIAAEKAIAYEYRDQSGEKFEDEDFADDPGAAVEKALKDLEGIDGEIKGLSDKEKKDANEAIKKMRALFDKGDKNKVDDLPEPGQASEEALGQLAGIDKQIKGLSQKEEEPEINALIRQDIAQRDQEPEINSRLREYIAKRDMDKKGLPFAQPQTTRNPFEAAQEAARKVQNKPKPGVVDFTGEEDIITPGQVTFKDADVISPSKASDSAIRLEKIARNILKRRV